VTTDALPDDIAALKAMLLAERASYRAEIEKLRHTIARLRHEQYGQSAERRALLDQLELQLGELEENQAQAEAAEEIAAPQSVTVEAVTRRKPARRPLPEHLPRERVVYPVPAACPCCGGALHKLGEDVTETLELVPRQWKVIQHVREKYSCRSCEKMTQPPAPSHPIARGRAGPGLLAHVLFAKYGLHLPLHRHSRTYAREGIELDVSTLADWVGASAADAAGRDDPGPCVRRPAPACRRHAGTGARYRPDPHRAAVDLRARRPAVRGPRAAGGCVLLLA
jgi:transposase